MEKSKEIWNSLNARERRTKGLECKTPSLTVPDQSMTIREIMERHAHGIAMPVGKEPIYSEDENQLGVNLKKLDLVELQELRERSQALIEGHLKGKQTAEKKEAKKREEEYRQRIIGEYEAEKQAKAVKNQPEGQ